MKTIIRRNVFETNSSASHSLIILPKDEYERWEDGGLYTLERDYILSYKEWKDRPQKGKLYTKEEVINMLKTYPYSYSDEYPIEEQIRDDGFITYEDWENIELEREIEEFITPSGDVMIADSKYGYDY